MKTILFILLTLVNYCIGNRAKDELGINHNDSSQLKHHIKVPTLTSIDDQSMQKDHVEKKSQQNREVLWQVNNAQLVNVRDKFRVNRISEKDQYGISVKVLPGGKALAYTWASWHLPQEAEAFRIFMLQMFDEGGNPISAYSQVNPNDQNAFPPLPILHTGNNQLMSVWSGEVVDEKSATFRIHGRFFDSNGNLNPNHFLISNETWGFSSDNPDGKCQENVCVVTWNAFGPNNIYMQELYTNGTRIGYTKRVNVNVTSSSLKKVAPEVVFFSNGNRLILWLDQRNDYTKNSDTYYDVYAQLIHKNGTKLLKNDLKINLFTHVPVGGTVAADSFKKGNRIIIVWEGISTTKTINRVYYRMITSDGKVINFEQALELELVNPNKPANNELPNRYPDVRVLIDDFYAITWSSFIDHVSRKASIAMQVFKNNTVPIGPEVNVSNEIAVNARYPKIDAYGNLITVGWESQKENLDVWARLFKFFIAAEYVNFSPTFKFAVWWKESKNYFFIITCSTSFIMTVSVACFLASMLGGVNHNHPIDLL